MPEYREIAAPPDRAQMVECIWTMRTGAGEPPYRVTPDGCADILFTRCGSEIRLEAVGPMTVYRDFALPAGASLLGIRLRPGMWSRHFGIPGDRLTDVILPLEDLWGSRARELAERLAGLGSLEQAPPLLCPGPSEFSPAQRAISWLQARHGCVPVDKLAFAAGLSPRQFRRVCLELTGLTPKFLARVLRFRRALAATHAGRVDCASIAADCGYYDQPHLIRDFREFAGRTPMTDFYNTPAGRPATIYP